MTKLPQIHSVIEGDLCIACGACLEVCPRKNLAQQFDTYNGSLQASIIDTNSCEGCDAPCERVCPSIEVDIVKMAKAFNGQDVDGDREGPIIKRYVGYSKQFQFNGVSSSGGIIRELVSYHLKAGNNVVCLGRVGEDFGPVLVESIEGLASVPGSIYHSISFYGAIEHIKQSAKPVVLVTIPCHLEGLVKYSIETGWDVKQHTSLIVGIICGWMYSRHTLDSFAAFNSINRPVISAEYRGEDRVGFLKLKTPDDVYKFSRRKFDGLKGSLNYKASFSKYANRLRCRLCQNHLNVLADLSVGDAWLARNPKNKLSVIATRTERGNEAINKLVADELVVLEPGLETDLIESQSKNLVYGLDAQNFTRYLEHNSKHYVKFNYGEKNEQKAPAEVESYAHELRMRNFLRSGQYNTYRVFYAFKMLNDFIKRKLRKGS